VAGLTFALLFHEYPRSADQLIRAIVQFHADARILYGVDRPASFAGTQLLELREATRERRRIHLKPFPMRWTPGSRRARPIPQRRRWSWRNLHRFLFDTCECVAADPPDWLVVADSDAMFTGPALQKILCDDWDYSVTLSGEGFTEWVHGVRFRRDWNRYEALARDLGLDPRPVDLGTIFGIFVLSSRSIRALAGIMRDLEGSEEFGRFEALPEPFPFYEALLPQLFADLGLRARDIRSDVPGCRNRPYWSPEEYREELWFYHPVHRLPSDPFRKLICERIGIDV